MAGDWIKMRCDLFTHPKVVRISSALKADTLRTVGGLMSAWCLFDAHSVDGKLEGYSFDVLDAHLRWPGFSEAMAAVGWLEQDGESLVLPAFDAHNGQSAKRRAQDASRKGAVRKMSASEADKMRNREEKRREEKKEKNIAPAKPSPDDLLSDVSEQVRRDFVALRRAKKAEITETAVAGLRREAASAGISLERALEICCERGWQGFKADWLPKAEPAALPGGGRRKLA